MFFRILSTLFSVLFISLSLRFLEASEWVNYSEVILIFSLPVTLLSGSISLEIHRNKQLSKLKLIIAVILCVVVLLYCIVHYNYNFTFFVFLLFCLQILSAAHFAMSIEEEKTLNLTIKRIAKTQIIFTIFFSVLLYIFSNIYVVLCKQLLDSLVVYIFTRKNPIVLTSKSLYESTDKAIITGQINRGIIQYVILFLYPDTAIIAFERGLKFPSLVSVSLGTIFYPYYKKIGSLNINFLFRISFVIILTVISYLIFDILILDYLFEKFSSDVREKIQWMSILWIPFTILRLSDVIAANVGKSKNLTVLYSLAILFQIIMVIVGVDPFICFIASHSIIAIVIIFLWEDITP